MYITTYIHKIIFFVIAFFTIGVYSQDLQKIKKSDTIYVLFKQNLNSQFKYSSNKKDNLYYEKIKYFLINSSESNKKTKIVYRFLIDDYLSYLFEYENTVIKSKSFIDENKDIIMDYDYLKQIGLNEVKYLFEFKPYIYLIDSNCIGKKKIKIKKVSSHIIVTND